jgi:hypothetical protein
MMGAKIPPTRPLVEHNPTIALLPKVGNSSDVYEKRVAVTQAANSLATSAKTVLIDALSLYGHTFNSMIDSDMIRNSEKTVIYRRVINRL